jgi:hypothetical protein
MATVLIVALVVVGLGVVLLVAIDQLLMHRK